MIQQSFALDARIAQISSLDSVEACSGSTWRPSSIRLRVFWHSVSILGGGCERLLPSTLLLASSMVSPLLRIAVHRSLRFQCRSRMTCALSALQSGRLWSSRRSFRKIRVRGCRDPRRWSRHDSKFFFNCLDGRKGLGDVNLVSRQG